ncbi:unnamed protein product [Peronospora destructor]|uniref:NAD(P)-binding domain-containing protein n=1 Tax=Peronospora destructor TaxID=86335 RepID=A0AAV0T2X9_9STRA|nr:unnamed protein product [Peronospora destructor]
MATMARRIRQRSMHTFKAYDKSEHCLLVVGGNGFVGINILQRAVQKGVEACALAKAVEGVTGVVSAVGAFGNKEFMEKMCGDATIQAVQAAQKAGVERFVFVSNSRVATYNPPWQPLYGYYHGKERAEAAVHARFQMREWHCVQVSSMGGVAQRKVEASRCSLLDTFIDALRDKGQFQLHRAVCRYLVKRCELQYLLMRLLKAAVLSAIESCSRTNTGQCNMLRSAASFHLHE